MMRDVLVNGCYDFDKDAISDHIISQSKCILNCLDTVMCDIYLFLGREGTY